MFLRWVIRDCLRQVRLAQGRTLREVAEAAGVSIGHLSAVERGLKEASWEVLAAICRALGLDLADLLEAAHLALTGWRTPQLGTSSRLEVLGRARDDVTLAA